MAKRKMSAAQRRFFGKKGSRRARVASFAGRTARKAGKSFGKELGMFLGGLAYGVVGRYTDPLVANTLPQIPASIKQGGLALLAAKMLPGKLKYLGLAGLAVEGWQTSAMVPSFGGSNATGSS